MPKTLAPGLQLVGPTGERSDDALCRAFLAGDPQAFGELVRRHQELVYRLVRRFSSRPDDAADLTQRAFLRAFEASRRSLPRLGRAGPVPFRAWLVRIALNLGKNQLRESRRWKLAPVTLNEPAPIAAAPDALARVEQEQQVRAAVLTLPRRQREVLTLRVDGALRFSEVAEALGITEANAKVHFGLAVKRLKEALAAPLLEETR